MITRISHSPFGRLRHSGRIRGDDVEDGEEPQAEQQQADEASA